MLYIIYERWKTIKQNNWKIKVSSLGRVKYNHKILTPQIDEHGYFQLDINGRMYHVHSLVAIAFLGKKKGDDLTVDHVDSNKRNNMVKNLELVSREENLKRAQQKLGVSNIKYIKGFDQSFCSISSALNYYLSNKKVQRNKYNLVNFEEKIMTAAQNGTSYLGTTWQVETRW